MSFAFPPVCALAGKIFADLDTSEARELPHTETRAAFLRITNDGPAPRSVVAVVTKDSETLLVFWSSYPGEVFSRGNGSSACVLGVGESRLLLIAIAPIGVAWCAVDNPESLRPPSRYFVGEQPIAILEDSLTVVRGEIKEACGVHVRLISEEGQFAGNYRLALNPPRFDRARTKI
ncbi:MAG TPA: hypothetical protein VH988_30935 [Thermoanaerobaculia bacterium]|nr:hypothetical protein [Thermoanaerobaculia bacterium]